MNYEIGRTPRILVGSEHLSSLPTILKSWERASAVLIVDAVIADGEYLKTLKEHLNGVSIAQYIIPAGEPTVDSVNAAAIYARSFPRAVIVGVGGGSALDIAKQVAVTVASHEGIEHYLLCANPFQGRRPIIAIPTTSGTGAEVTRTCIVSDTDGRKLWTWGDEMLPDLVILDPSVTITMPVFVTATTGLDAFAHALEANTGKRRNAISSANALHAMKLIRQHLPTAVSHPENRIARAGMQEAALLAGLAIDNSGTGIAHCIGHALGTLYHIPHGVAVTIALEATLAWNAEGATEAYSSAAEVFGVKPNELSHAFKQLLQEVQFANAIKTQATLEPQAIAELMNAPENQPMLNNNARAVNEVQRLELAELTVRVWEGYVK
jgi:alcohol dehydrogenase class IV